MLYLYLSVASPNFTRLYKWVTNQLVTHVYIFHCFGLKSTFARILKNKLKFY